MQVFELIRVFLSCNTSDEDHSDDDDDAGSLAAFLDDRGSCLNQ